MKYGIVVYKETANIGDDIQCVAAEQFLPQVDVELDREFLHEVESDEPIACIMNGWWLHRKWNWPPANCLRPLFVAYHYADYEKAQFYGHYLKNQFIDNGLGMEYFKAWGPVGCRDSNTHELMQKLGIDSWFSGCMTLTLPQMEKIPQEKKYICFVDLNPRAAQPLMEKAADEGIEVRTMTHAITPYAPEVPWSERSAKAKELLTIYQNATCVVTSRLHCALPCLALGTPVLLVRPDLDNIRFQPFTQWLHTATVDDALEGRVDYSFIDPPANNGGHIPTREKLIETCKNFIAHAGELEEKFTPTEVERLRWSDAVMRQQLEENLSHYRDDMVAHAKEVAALKREIAAMEKKGRKPAKAEKPAPKAEKPVKAAPAAAPASRQQTLNLAYKGEIGPRFLMKCTAKWFKGKMNRMFKK
ncbi:MAG: polysaccharide pyruvyl transferase family protein [Clostridia bacterium]|nr:polysaccharide pyruvyl transferase family protein [Clostridia bacterium]